MDVDLLEHGRLAPAGSRKHKLDRGQSRSQICGAEKLVAEPGGIASAAVEQGDCMRVLFVQRGDA